ncbi:hypothetical protein TWF281_003003 [Arthrobotrys megalospora]
MVHWARNNYGVVCSLFLFSTIRAETVQITNAEFAGELLRNHDSYIKPFRTAAQDLIKLATVTYPITGNEPGYEGQETVRGYILDARNAVDAVMNEFAASLSQDSEQNPSGAAGEEIVIGFLKLRTAILNYMQASVVTDPGIWSSQSHGGYWDMPSMDIWVLINKLRMRFAVCCADSIPDGDEQALKWILNGEYDEEAGLWTMRPEDTKYRVQILGAMIDGLNNLKVPAKEEIDDIKAAAIKNNFPASTYEPLPKIIADLEPIIQAFIENLRSIRYKISGIHIEFTNRFVKDE